MSINKSHYRPTLVSHTVHAYCKWSMLGLVKSACKTRCILNLVMWFYKLMSTLLPLYSAGTVASVCSWRAFDGASSLLPVLARDYTNNSINNRYVYDFPFFFFPLQSKHHGEYSVYEAREKGKTASKKQNKLTEMLTCRVVPKFVRCSQQ